MGGQDYQGMVDRKFPDALVRLAGLPVVDRTAAKCRFGELCLVVHHIAGEEQKTFIRP